MKEKDAQSRFTKYIRESGYDKSAAFELKFRTEGTALPFSAFEPQQIPSLLKAKQACIYKKLSDADHGLKPFDALQICNAEAWVIACWWHIGKGIWVYWIDIDDFVAEQGRSTRKSLTEDRASELAYHVHILT